MIEALLTEVMKLRLEQEKIAKALQKAGIAKTKDLQTSITEILDESKEFKRQVKIGQSFRGFARRTTRRTGRPKPFRIK